MMKPELIVLVFATLLQCGHMVVFAIVAGRQVGTKATAGPRDTPLTLTGRVGRLQRALNNMFEALILFTIAVVALELMAKADHTTAILAHVFLAARVLYIPAYVYGWVPWRSLIWGIGWGSTVAMLILAVV